MKITFNVIMAAVILAVCSCNTGSNTDPKADSSTVKQDATLPIMGTWQLLTGTLVDKKKNDTVVTDYTKDQSQIKIINGTHFSFLNHKLDKKKTGPADFVAGGGHYTLVGDKYTEMLEYCSDRQWEDNKFEFTVTINNDTLVQTGIEKIDSIGVNRLNIEKYIRIK